MLPKRKLKTDLKKFSFFLLIFSCLFVNSVFPSDEIDLFDKTEGDSLKLAKALELLKQDNILSNQGKDAPMPESGNDKIIPSSTNNTNGAMALSSWDGGGDGYSWKDAANWVGDVVPTSNDTVMLANGNSIQLIDTTGYCYKLILQNGASLTIGSRTLNAGNDIEIQSGGNMSLSGTIYVGGDWKNSGNFTPNFRINSDYERFRRAYR